MVDPVDLLFLEMLADRIVDRLRGCQVVTERLFQDYARKLVYQASAGQVVADGGKQSRRRRQIEHSTHAIARRRCETSVIIRIGHIEFDVVEGRQETVPGGRLQRFLVNERARLFLHEAEIVVACPILAPDG